MNNYKNITYFMIFVTLFGSCKYKTNNEIINYLQNEFRDSNNKYRKMINIIFELNLNYKNCVISDFKDYSFSVYDIDNNMYPINYPANKGKELGLMMYNSKCIIRVNKNENINFVFNFKNKNGDSYRLIYSILDKVNYQKLYPDFEIIKGDERPTKNGGWIYIINSQWIIYSPHKTNKNDDDQITKYIQLYLLAIAIVFIIMKVLKKRKQ